MIDESAASGASLKIMTTSVGAVARFEPGPGVELTGSAWAEAIGARPVATSASSAAA
jgi:phage baseplate assembly protein W